MKIKKLGLEWGAAYAEAQPIHITHGSAVVEIYADEANELVIEIPEGCWAEPAQVFDKTIGLRIRLRGDE